MPRVPSSGTGVHDDKPGEILLFKQVGKVAALRELISESTMEMIKFFNTYCASAHTRWVTHGSPSPFTYHPLRSTSRTTVVQIDVVTN